MNSVEAHLGLEVVADGTVELKHNRRIRFLRLTEKGIANCQRFFANLSSEGTVVYFPL